jgi:hypothetical protein
VARLIDSEDLTDANGVAEILQLSHRNTVSQYQRRYSDMPRPVVDLAGGRTKLWLRSEIISWAAGLAKAGRTRPGGRILR